MKLISDGKFTSEKSFVRLDSIEIGNRGNDHCSVRDGMVFLPVSVYNEIIGNDIKLIRSLYPHVDIKYGLVYNYDGPRVELKKAYNNDNLFVCHAWCYSPDYNIPEYKFTIDLGEIANP
ncbi:MAG: hypothetical protein ACJA1C_002864 [Crocinitomicaceae bacterium]|jgi:hypothetical protein